jgi:hypothetical protein
MRQTFLDSKDDMLWLREIHWPTLPAEYQSAMIYGNEDWPSRIEAYTSPCPRVTDIPLILSAEQIDAHHGGV